MSAKEEVTDNGGKRTEMNNPTPEGKEKPKNGAWYIGRLIIWMGVVIGAVLPQTFESYYYATLYHWYGEYHLFSTIGWIFVVIGLLVEGIGWLHGKN